MLQFLIAGGPFMLLLVLTSIVSLTFIIERGLALRRGRVVPLAVADALKRWRGSADLTALKVTCQQGNSTLGRLVLTAIEYLPLPRQENQEAVQTEARQEVVHLERGLVVLEVVVGISPLLGLVGTLHGLITLFGDLGRSGLADNSVLAKGIAIALNTTLMGLLIAIPSLVFWSYFTKKVETLGVEMETRLEDFLRHQYRLRRHAHPEPPAVEPPVMATD
jgi:biopolymer transport protein ExbB